jgi:CHAD domain-containing protein
LTIEIKLSNAQKPLKKLRKALKSLPADPTAEDVHELRTHTRRLEAIVDTFLLDRKKKTRHLLKAVTPVRKAAGEVRDMDVLVGKVLALAPDHSNDSLVRLVEHLGEMRLEGARQLRHTVAAHRKDARRSLKDYSRLVGRQFPGKAQVVSSAESVPTHLATELANWPRLNPENIHPFRIKIKQLRYMLQLSEQADKDLVNALGSVKDEVGDWHDWQELARIANQVLDPEGDRGALKRIAEIGDKKLRHALAVANSVRSRYFTAGSRNGHAHRGNGRPHTSS